MGMLPEKTECGHSMDNALKRRKWLDHIVVEGFCQWVLVGASRFPTFSSGILLRVAIGHLAMVTMKPWYYTSHLLAQI